MKKIWTYIENKKWKETTKYNCLILFWCVAAALAGFGLWLIIRNWAFSSIECMICFIGYPVVISWIAAIMYSMKHEFHE